MTPLSNTDIDALERTLSFTIPGLYRKLLVEIGYGQIGDVEIYHPKNISELYEFHFENKEDLFTNYFPFGCDNRAQDIWLIRPSDERAASISHETHSDDYDDESWLEYHDWIAAHTKQLNQLG
jgi:hypothetical protein